MNSNRSNSNFVMKADGESVESEVNQWSNPRIQRNNSWPAQWFRCLVKGYFIFGERVDKWARLLYNMDNFIKTVEAGIKAMEAITESPDCWEPDMKHTVKWAAEGARERENLSMLRRVGMRQLPGVCWYFAKARGIGREPRWHRG